MADRSAEPWYATAAYLYVLHLDGPALAWEYLRRHPDYRHDWLRRRRPPDAAGHWGLRLLEDPALDAWDAHPAWFPDHDAVVQLYPDADPPPDALCFEFWKLPGHKHLIHDGKRLVLVARWPGCCLRFVLAPGLADGMAYAYAIRACAAPCERYAALASELNKIAGAAGAVQLQDPVPDLDVAGHRPGQVRNPAFAEVVGDDAMRLFGRMGDAAGDLRHLDTVRHEAEGHGLVVCRLHLQSVPGDGATVQARGRAGFQPTHH